jgi:hypothetical protein
VLYNSLLSLARIGGMTLCEAVPLLLHRGFRQAIVQKLQNDQLGVAPFWAWFEALGEAERATVVAPVLSRLRAFTNHAAAPIHRSSSKTIGGAVVNVGGEH